MVVTESVVKAAVKGGQLRTDDLDGGEQRASLPGLATTRRSISPAEVTEQCRVAQTSYLDYARVITLRLESGMTV